MSFLNLTYDDQFPASYAFIAGVDEAGRGAWAGPVVSSAVIFDRGLYLEGVNDSKKLSPAKRKELSLVIKEKALAYAYGVVESDQIDRVNILEATKDSMLQAVNLLTIKPTLLLIDGNAKIKTNLEQITVIDGDARSHSIAAASILAKVYRDELMAEWAVTYPHYGFEKHKGYGTKAHQEAIRERGVLSIHRQSYAPIAEFSQANGGVCVK